MDGIIRNSLSELLPMTKGENGINTVNAHDLYAFLGSKQHFADWIKNRIEQYGFLENQDFQMFCYDWHGNLLNIRYHNFMKSENQQVSKIEYSLSVGMAKELSMIENNEQGKRARRYFIECENMLRSMMEQRLKEQQQQVDEAKRQMESQQPKVVFAESVANSGDTISMDELAKLITQNGYIINRNELFAWMVGNGYLLRKVRRVGRKRVNDYAPSQEAARLHLFRLNAEHVPNIGLTRYTCRVTGNGQIFFVSRFNGMINR